MAAGPTVTFRLPVITVIAMPACLIIAGLLLLSLASQHHSAPIGSAGIYLLFLAAACLLLTVALRVELSPAGVRIRGLGRNRLVGWAQVRAVTAEPHRRRGRRVTLWTESGPVPVPLPLGRGTENEASFVRGYHQIGQYWLAHRDPSLPVVRHPGW